MWSALNIDLAGSPRVKHDLFLEKLGIDRVDFEVLENALNLLWYADIGEQPPAVATVLAYLRQNMLLPNDWSSLRQRFIL